MDDLRKRIRELEIISQSLDPSEEQRNQLLQKVQDFSNHFLNNIESGKAYSAEKADRSKFLTGSGKKPISDILKVYSEEVTYKGIKAASRLRGASWVYPLGRDLQFGPCRLSCRYYQ